mmetsp:Transcript_28320/g.57508  ORF Transcript_28320/g.57508 Transcript_28320/m.57508 type:complete len:166 (+) Transcript_28320:257-754(+)
MLCNSPVAVAGSVDGAQGDPGLLRTKSGKEETLPGRTRSLVSGLIMRLFRAKRHSSVHSLQTNVDPRLPSTRKRHLPPVIRRMAVDLHVCHWAFKEDWIAFFSLDSGDLRDRVTHGPTGSSATVSLRVASLALDNFWGPQDGCSWLSLVPFKPCVMFSVFGLPDA